jgi:hypothetical protein
MSSRKHLLPKTAVAKRAPADNSVCYPREQIIEVLRELNLIVVSPERTGSAAASVGNRRTRSRCRTIKLEFRSRYSRQGTFCGIAWGLLHLVESAPEASS